MADLDDGSSRSLGATLTAAASTFALFAAVNWELAGIIGYYRGFFKRLLMHTAIAFTMPLCALFLSVHNAFCVWAVSRRLKEKLGHLCPDHGSIAIITLCPIYIQFPSSSTVGLGRYLGGYNPVTDLKGLKDLYPLELRPPSGALHVHAAHAQEDALHMRYLQLPDTCISFNLQNVGEREALLAAGLAPEYDELSFLRSRSRFQALVTAMQASGYVLSVIQRMAQHRAISPVEAIVTFLSLLVVLQLTIELYACGNYQRPLLLRLQPHQLARFRDASRTDFVDTKDYVVLVLFIVFTLLLISIPSLGYLFHYLHAYRLCSLCALLFLVAQIACVILFTLPIFLKDIGDIAHLIILCSNLVFGSSILLAVISTIKYWKVFENPSHDWFSWILPHAFG